MLAFALVILAFTGATTGYFNITKLIVPAIVHEHQDEVELECYYDGNFTILNWFKGNLEFFRYVPEETPSNLSFPIDGVRKIETLTCGLSYCHLRLSGLTNEASGNYKCDIERAIRPYRLASKSAYMQVVGHEYPKPWVEGLAEEYGEGEDIRAYCRASPDTEIIWYVNGREMVNMKGMVTLRMISSKYKFVGDPLTLTVQCAEWRQGKLSGSNKAQARWKQTNPKEEIPQEQRNASNALTCFGFLSSFCVIFNQLLF